ncbi:UNVERIFIED_CONTAM: hypothetical protein FKN15_044716 [Acipenser sinensis]
MIHSVGVASGLRARAVVNVTRCTFTEGGEPCRAVQYEITDDRACTNGKEESPEVAVGDGEGAGLVEVQDAAFPVKIQVPGVELFELQVRCRELAQSLLQALGEREETCQRTCYSLQLQGVALDPLSELGAVEGLAPGAVLRLLEEPYSLRDARVHVARLQELLRSLDPHDALRGRAGRSLSFLESVDSGGCQEDAVPGSSGVKPQRLGCDPVDCPPPGHILPGSKDRPLLPLQPGSADSKAAPCLLALALSRWSPPPGNRKLHGDLLYLSVRTVEGRSADITSCPRGFYINQSTPEEFHPQAASPSLLSHSLSDLLAQLSPAFKRGFTALLRKRLQLHPLERIGTPYQTYSWTAPSIVHSTDWDSCCWEEQAPGQTRDWNEELQASRELPQTSLAQRLLRDRALFKVNSDFVSTAVRGAVAVIDGGAAPLNPGEDPRLHVFLWGGVFLSLAGEGGSLGGERAARAVPRLDLAGVQAYSGAQGLHTLATALLDYRGYRLSAQALVPGLLEQEGDNRVCYGGSDSGRNPAATRRFLELLGVAAKPLRIQRHRVLQPSGSETTLYTSADCKGLVGNDGRYYILDLFKTFPPDLNFLPQGEGEGEGEGAGEGEGWPPGYTSLGFPREFPHKLCRLRPELVESFIQHKYTQFMNLVMERMQEKKHDDSGEGVKGVSPKDADPRGVDAVRAACRDVGSVSNIVFEIRFNPDASEPGVRIPDSEGEALPLQRRLLREAAVFLVTVQIPAFVSDCLHQLTVPVDGATLTEALHQRGISLRYMGRIAELISQSENKWRDGGDVGSVSNIVFEIRFNPDASEPGVRIPDSEGEALPLQRRLLREAAVFLVTVQIPAFVRNYFIINHSAVSVCTSDTLSVSRYIVDYSKFLFVVPPQVSDCLHQLTVPVDGATLTEALHQRGINLRYMGRIAELISQSENKQRLQHVYRLLISETVTRSARRILNTYLQGVELSSLSAAVSHFLNCLLCSCPCPVVEPGWRRRRSRRRGRAAGGGNVDSTTWTSLTPVELWLQIGLDVRETFDLTAIIGGWRDRGVGRQRMERWGGETEDGEMGWRDGVEIWRADPRGVDAVRAACRDVGSVSNIVFEIRFNPDASEPGVRIPDSEGEALPLQRRLLREAAVFLVTVQIPAFVSDCLHQLTVPVDGATLTEALHQRGINLRYMGRIAELISQSENKQRLQHVYRLLISETVTRSARRILNTYLQGVELSSLSAAVSHFLNCLLCSCPCPVVEPGWRRRRSRRRGRAAGGGNVDSTTWTSLTPVELWLQIGLDVRETFDLTAIIGDNVDHLVELYGLQKVTLLRELCERVERSRSGETEDGEMGWRDRGWRDGMERWGGDMEGWTDPRGVDAVRAACRDVGSVSNIVFEIRFNPDASEPGVRIPDSEGEALPLQRRLLREAAVFLVTVQIPAFVSDCLHQLTVPVDGATLTEALHQRGISLRYMGRIAELISQSENKQRLQHVYRLLISETVTRSARRILNTYLQGVELSSLSAAVSHFLNCLLCSCPCPVVEPGWRRRRSRRRGRAAGGGNVDSTTWTSLTPVELWLQIGLDVRETFDLTAIIGDNVDHLVELYGLQKVTLLRELCVKSGIQLLLREYSLDSRQKPPFAPEDVLNIFPVVKRLATATSDGTRVFRSAQASLQRGCVKEGYQQLQKALSLFTEVCGPLHRDTCACLHSLAKIAFLSGRRTEVHLALYQFSEGGVTAALRLLYRARYLLLLEHGEDHPYTATLDSNLGLILQVALQWEPALRFLHSALDVNVKFRGALSLHSALSHKQTKASSRFLSLVMQQAVDLQRSLNEICRSGSGAVAPLQISHPSLEDTLEQLGLINGILCVSASINSEEPTNNSDTTAKLEELASNQKKEVELLANETSDTKTDVPALVHQVELNTNEETATESLTNGNADAERAPPLPIQEEFSSDEETVIEDVTSEDRGPEKDMPTSNQEEILSDEKTSPSLVTNGNNPETDT